MTIKGYVCAFIGTVGAGLAYLFGGFDANMITLLIFMAIDFCLGLIVAALFKKSKKTKSGALSSKECLRGIAKKVGSLVLIIIGERVDIIFGSDVFRNAVIISVITSEAISIIENLGLMGIPMPNILKKAIEVLKDKSGDSEKSSPDENQ